MTPGKTSGQDTKSFLERFESLAIISIHDEKGGYIQWQVLQNGLIVWPRLEYRINSSDRIVERFKITVDIVREIEGNFKTAYGDPLFTPLFLPYSLSRILSSYGQPSAVLVWGNRGMRQFNLLLSYTEAGFLINYIMPLTLADQNFDGCPSKAYVELWIWPAKRSYTLSEAASVLFGESTGKDLPDSTGKDWLANYLSIEKATSLTAKKFYETYRNNKNTSCLKTPVNLWPES
jgi:hypothetical protein